MNNNNLKFIELIPLLVGLVLIFTGIYMGLVAFNEARSLIHDPRPLSKWLALRADVHKDITPKKEEKKNSFNPLKRGKDFLKSIGSNTFEIAGGYLMLFLGLLFIWVLAKIAAVFIQHGGILIHKGTGNIRKAWAAGDAPGYGDQNKNGDQPGLDGG